MAVPARAAVGQQQCQLHHLGGHQWRVQANRSRRSGPPLGRAQIEAQHELRQAESRLEVSLTQLLHRTGVAFFLFVSIYIVLCAQVLLISPRVLCPAKCGHVSNL